jgi:hypothetical protein
MLPATLFVAPDLMRFDARPRAALSTLIHEARTACAKSHHDYEFVARYFSQLAPTRRCEAL